MNLQMTYSELEAYIQQKYQQQVGLMYVNENTIKVGATIDLKLFTKKVEANVSVEQVEGENITLAYDAGIGLDQIIQGALMWFKDSIEGFVEELPGKSLVVHLGNIEQLEKALEQIELQGICFDESNINVQFCLK